MFQGVLVFGGCFKTCCLRSSRVLWLSFQDGFCVGGFKVFSCIVFTVFLFFLGVCVLVSSVCGGSLVPFWNEDFPKASSRGSFQT